MIDSFKNKYKRPFQIQQIEIITASGIFVSPED